jgi:hypothetical protein
MSSDSKGPTFLQAAGMILAGVLMAVFGCFGVVSQIQAPHPMSRGGVVALELAFFGGLVLLAVGLILLVAIIISAFIDAFRSSESDGEST